MGHFNPRTSCSLREESQREQSGAETTRNGKRLEVSYQCWVNTREDTRALVDIWPLLFQVLLDANKADIEMVKRTDRAIPGKKRTRILSYPVPSGLPNQG